jgi:ABC-type transport system involved in multi-copper enzyme maturation permease subunit
MVPAIMLGRGTPADMFSSAYLGNMMYVIAIILSISIGVYAANANELSEMTFIISRPVSRRTFLLAKSLCVLGIALCLYI